MAVINPTATQTRNELQAIKNQWNDIRGLSGDQNYVDKDDLLKVTQDTSDKFSVDTKAAAQYLLDNPDQFNDVANSDHSQRTPGGNFSWQDMDQFAKNNGAPLADGAPPEDTEPDPPAEKQASSSYPKPPFQLMPAPPEDTEPDPPASNNCDCPRQPLTSSSRYSVAPEPRSRSLMFASGSLLA